MGLLDVVRSGIALANSVTSDLQANVSHRAWTASSSYGDATLATAVLRPAIVVQSFKMHRTSKGEMVATRAHITFLEPITPNGAAGRMEPIDPRDTITLPDGTTGPIVDISGFIDRETTRPLLVEVWLGVGQNAGSEE